MIARSLLAFFFVLCSLSAADRGLSQIKSVYLLPMSGGLDQYLANRLTSEGRFSVVTDPAKADAVFTDRLGIDFEARMTELYPPPPTPEELARQKEREKKREAGEEEYASIGSLLGEVGTGGTRISSFSRGKGNVFLVDRNNRQVLWSFYARPRSTRPDELNDIAGDISGKLHAEIKRQLKEAARAEKAIAPAVTTPAPATPVAAPATQPPATAPAPQSPATPAPKQPASPAPQPDKKPPASK